MFSVEEREDMYIVRINKQEADIDINSVEELKKTLEEGIEKGYKKIIVDFKNVSYIDSSGLGCLMDIMKKEKEKNNGEVGILSIKPEILEVFTATKIAQFFRFYKSLPA